MENDEEIKEILPIQLDINNIQIKSVRIEQLSDEAVVDKQFIRTLKNDEKVLELLLEPSETEEKMKLSVTIDFVSQITNTLQGIYKVDYKDDFGAVEE